MDMEGWVLPKQDRNIKTNKLKPLEEPLHRSMFSERRMTSIAPFYTHSVYQGIANGLRFRGKGGQLL